jgi:hypothetical protein
VIETEPAFVVNPIRISGSLASGKNTGSYATFFWVMNRRIRKDTDKRRDDIR